MKILTAGRPTGPVVHVRSIASNHFRIKTLNASEKLKYYASIKTTKLKTVIDSREFDGSHKQVSVIDKDTNQLFQELPAKNFSSKS